MASAKMRDYLALHKDLTARRVTHLGLWLISGTARDPTRTVAELEREEALLDLLTRSLALAAAGQPDRAIRELWGDRADLLPAPE